MPTSKGPRNLQAGFLNIPLSSPATLGNPPFSSPRGLAETGSGRPRRRFYRNFAPPRPARPRRPDGEERPRAMRQRRPSEVFPSAVPSCTCWPPPLFLFARLAPDGGGGGTGRNCATRSGRRCLRECRDPTRVCGATAKGSRQEGSAERARAGAVGAPDRSFVSCHGACGKARADRNGMHDIMVLLTGA
jgi:hypothetical protein